MRTPLPGAHLTLALLVMYGASACRPAPAAPPTQAPVIAVAVAPAVRESVHAPLSATGTLVSRDEIPLAFKIGGVVARVHVDEGQPVRRGQVLATLDQREIDAVVARSAAALEKAERDEARVHRLFLDSVTTRAQWQDAASALAVARADHAATRVNREYATIVAPENGMVLRREAAATAGATIAPGAPVLLLGGGRRGRVFRAGLTDRDALRVRAGDRVRVHFDAAGVAPLDGTVSLRGRAADTRTGTYTVEVTLVGADTLPNGLVGRADFAVQGGAMATVVPVDALVEADADSATVYTVAGTAQAPTARQHRVRLLTLLGDRVAVDGVPAGAQMITRGAQYVMPGARVRIAAEPVR